MTTSALLQEGLHLMAIGMGAVFVFLVLLIVSMLVTARLVRAIESRHGTASVTSDTPGNASATPQEVVAAITLAVRRYRNTHKH